MKLQTRLELLPKNAIIISKDLAYAQEKEMKTFFNAAGPIHSFHKDDKMGIRYAGGIFAYMKLASPDELAKALSLHRSTIFRYQNIYKESGLSGILPRTPGPKEAHKLRGEKLKQAQKLLEKNFSNVDIGKAVGVSEGTIRKGIKDGNLKKPSLLHEDNKELLGPHIRSKIDSTESCGVGVKRHSDRSLARQGKLSEANPEFSASEAVENAGALLALPIIMRQGLFEVGEKVYGSLRNGFFGLRSILLFFILMALIRIKTPEQLTEHSPGELGILLGLDRAPEVKTIRRKLKEISESKGASRFNAELTERWVQEEPEWLGYLYIDGYVRPYNGRKHTLPKMYVPNRHLCMAGTKEFWINDSTSSPLFFVTSPATDSLLSILKEKALPKIRKLVGKERRVTIIFDREGWSPKTFKNWYNEGIDVITYRKGSYDPWEENCFQSVKGDVEGKKVSYKLGERSIMISKGFWMREVRRLCKDGHQTSILTTRQDIPSVEIGYRMFFRWSQENFFQYMNREFNFNHLYTYDVEPADPNRLVPNPERKRKEKHLKRLKTELSKLERKFGQDALSAVERRNDSEPAELKSNTKMPPNREMQNDLLKDLYWEKKKIEELQKRCEILEKEIKSFPEKTPLKNVLDKSKIVQLERERMSFMNGIKMIAYRTESALANLIRPFFPRHEDEARKYLKTVFQLPADIIPDEINSHLIVRIHGMSNPHQNSTLKALCNVINKEGVCYPETNLKLTFQTI